MIIIDENKVQLEGNIVELLNDVMNLIYEYPRTDSFKKLKTILDESSNINKIMIDIEKLSNTIAELTEKIKGENNDKPN